jgi:DNA-binding FadR family transcriptional regulator
VQVLSGDARRAVFAPLDDGVLRSEAVVRRVGSAIALGLLGDGEQLPAEAELATMLNVSTVTLRDALAELRERGLVETRRGRGGGSFVRAGDDALAELADARLADGRASIREIARVREIVDRLAAAPTTTAQRRADGRFYVEMAAAAHSVRLTMQEMELHLELGQLPWPPAHVPQLLGEIVDAHRAVLDAVECRDAARARDLTEQHVDRRTRWTIDHHLERLRHAPATGRTRPLTAREAAR